MPKHDDPADLNSALNLLPQRFHGPGGVAAVLSDGHVVASRAWGYASLEDRGAMGQQTRLPICSISKQFTCGVLLAAGGEPEAFDAQIPAFLPSLLDPMPTTRQLCHNQSGLRDYWAMTVLDGAKAEQTFHREDALPMISSVRSGHFPPGSGYSYCNCNYRILSEMIETMAGETLEYLYRRHIWGPAGMNSAVLTSDTRHPADGVVGYEGNDLTGFFPADNGIYWIGDAGISASLEDMIAYESWIDRTRNEVDSLYGRLSERPFFADGTPASYGFGLVHEQISGVDVTGHGGALRGFRAHRMHSREHRLSVIVMFNHEASAHDAAEMLFRSALGITPKAARLPSRDWDGQWLCPETGLLARIETKDGEPRLHFATSPEDMREEATNRLVSEDVVLEQEGDALRMRRLRDNLTTLMQPVARVKTADETEIAGSYLSTETAATMTLEARDGAIFAIFSGRFGSGRPEPVYPAAPDIWLIRTRRSMDAPAPGDWTLRIKRDTSGRISGAELGCWLARKLGYEKQR
ncbi:MAG: aminopeptidase [Cereibacter sphaeroides]|uniref:Aminopeptidase n=1 Tax=Cereibacter sphaeroides TaxID=1063 RepID=A0A2W5S7W6_CERSP|nr:MAG: aminopeptidase [Cereibacter sphaeroides]